MAMGGCGGLNEIGSHKAHRFDHFATGKSNALQGLGGVVLLEGVFSGGERLDFQKLKPTPESLSSSCP